MFDKSWLTKVVTDFSGAWLIEEGDVPSQGALFSQNVRFAPGQVMTRYGCSSVFNPNNVITSMFNWIFADPTLGPKNILAWYSSDYGGIRTAELQAPGTGTDLYTQTAYGATFATGGSRLYVSHFDSSLAGKGHGRVYGYGVGVDNLFARPMLTSEITMTATEPGTGSVTPGLRKFGFVMTTRNGYTGKFAPVNGALVFQAGSFTNAGGKNMNVQLAPTGTWPSWAGSVQLIATTTANLSRFFFVPDTVLGVPAGGSLAVNALMDVSDDDLTTFGTEATDFNNLLTQDASNNPPFSPSVVFEYGNRLMYVVNSSAYGQCVFASQPNNYQALSADQNIRYLPGQKQINCGFALRGVAYYLGPFWTYADTDTDAIPVNWSAPVLVDGYHGTLSPRGVDVNVASGFAWVASRDGLYRFMGGHYDDLPVSYYQQPDWDRINWGTAGHTVVVRDNPATKVCTVFAPLDGASAPNFQMTWDYTNGSEPEQVKYSINPYSGLNAACGCMTMNQTTRKLEMWLGPGVAGPIVRQNDGSETHPYRDVAAAIDCVYETADFPGEDVQRWQVMHHHGAEFRITGAGAAGVRMYTLDKADNDPMQDIPLSATPGIEYMNLGDIVAESIRYQITNKDTLDNAFQLSLIRHAYSSYTEQR